MSQLKFLGLALILVLLLLAMNALFVVEQGSRALVVRLGKVERVDGKPLVQMPGLHFKLPLVDRLMRFDARLQNLAIDASRIVTAEKKDVIVDSFVKWRISNFYTYYNTTGGDVKRARVLLQQLVNDGLRAQFGAHMIEELLKSGTRDELMTNIRKQVDAQVERYGISVVDVRLKRLDLPGEVADSVFSRMRAEREQQASLIRAQGQKQAETIRAQADAKAIQIKAVADLNAQRSIAQGEKKAADVYARSYTQAPTFYRFFRSLQAYSSVFDHHQTVFVLKPDSQFFDYFNHDVSKK